MLRLSGLPLSSLFLYLQHKNEMLGAYKIDFETDLLIEEIICLLD
jgi:hypothetical protein